MSAAILAGEPPVMTYLVAADLPTAPAGQRFRTLLARPGILQLPGAHNGQAALQAKAAGFDGLYLSGAAMTASMGLPDLGVITVDEVCFFIRQIARSSGLPVLVDGDTGYGEALNVMHMVRSFEDAGAAAVHIEDQLLPKKCGHLNDKKLADAHDMAAKIAAAAKARKHLFIVARTDAAAAEGMDGAVARARLYLEAGADAIFPEALNTAAMFREFADRMPGTTLLANMTEFGRTPFFTAAEFQDMGYKMVIWLGVLAAGRQPARRAEAVPRRYGAMAARRTWSIACRRGPSCTRPSATMTTRRWTPRSSPPSSPGECRNVLDRRHFLALLALTPVLARLGAVRAQDKEPTGPQPELPKEKLVITTHDGVQHVFQVEMALKPEQQITGLMFRTSVPADRRHAAVRLGHAARPSQMSDEEHGVPARHGVHQPGRHDPLDRRGHGAAEPGGDRQPRTGARHAGAGGGDHGAAGDRGRRQGDPAHLRQRAVTVAPVMEAPNAPCTAPAAKPPVCAAPSLLSPQSAQLSLAPPSPHP